MRRKGGVKKSHGAASCESIEVFQAILEYAQLLLQFLTKLYGAVILGTEFVYLLILETPHHLRGEPVQIVISFIIIAKKLRHVISSLLYV